MPTPTLAARPLTAPAIVFLGLIGGPEADGRMPARRSRRRRRPPRPPPAPRAGAQDGADGGGPRRPETAPSTVPRRRTWPRPPVGRAPRRGCSTRPPPPARGRLLLPRTGGRGRRGGLRGAIWWTLLASAARNSASHNAVRNLGASASRCNQGGVLRGRQQDDQGEDRRERTGASGTGRGLSPAPRSRSP